MLENSLKLNSVGNARELGGIIINGKTVKRGVLLRTASLSALSSEDRVRLVNDYHVAVVVDLRMSMEREAELSRPDSGFDRFKAGLKEKSEKKKREKQNQEESKRGERDEAENISGGE